MVTKPQITERETQMDIHKNARSCFRSRVLLVHRFVVQGWKMKDACAAAGMTETAGYRWVKRWRQGGVYSLMDRSSRPHRSPKRTPGSVRRQIVALRKERRTGARIADELGVSPASISRILRQEGLSRIRDLEGPPPPPRRYEWEKPGQMIHVDIKALPRIVGGAGHRVNGDPSSSRRGRKRGVGYEYVHVCVDDASRYAYVETLPDQRARSAASFLRRAFKHFGDLGISIERTMTDNGPCYKSKLFKEACSDLNTRHFTTRPYTPRTNGKAERFIQTGLREWAYRFSYESSDERNELLPKFIHFYNHHREHSALAKRTPISRISLNNVLRFDN